MVGRAGHLLLMDTRHHAFRFAQAALRARQRQAEASRQAVEAYVERCAMVGNCAWEVGAQGWPLLSGTAGLAPAISSGQI